MIAGFPARVETAVEENPDSVERSLQLLVSLATDQRRARRWVCQPEQDPQRRCLPRPVWPEECRHPPRLGSKGEVAHNIDGVEPFREPVNGERWSVPWKYLYVMLVESILLGGLLLLIAQSQYGGLAAIESPAMPTLALQSGKAFGQLVAFFGAGIYEELLFRVILFPACAAALRFVGTPRRTSWVVAIFLSSLAFAAAHYQLDLMIGNLHLVTSYGDPFEWKSFLFRFTAGVFFATLMLARGFGVAAGTHAFYDILVSLPL